MYLTSKQQKRIGTAILASTFNTSIPIGLPPTTLYAVIRAAVEESRLVPKSDVPSVTNLIAEMFSPSLIDDMIDVGGVA